MTTTTIIFSACTALLGALITFLIMRIKTSSIIEGNKLHSSEIESLSKKLNEKDENLASLSENLQKAIIEKNSIQKELELKENSLKEKENDLSVLNVKLEQRVHETGSLKAEYESLKKEIELTKEYSTRNEKKIQLQKDENSALQEKISKQNQAAGTLKAELESAKKELELTKKKVEEKDSMISNREQQLTDLNSKIEKQRNSNSEIVAQRDTALKEVAILKEQMERSEKERSEAFNQQLQMAKEQLQNATQDILKQREESLNKANNEQMGNVVTPLKEQLEAIQKQVTENIKTTTDNKASIEKAIDELLKRTLEIGNDANNLARALKNESKTQGNWGELILEKLLESSGLEEGVHYDRQTTIRDNTGKPVFHDETGKRLIPDIIIHYPDGKDCIIDSKVSLSDYLDYCNAETDDVREQALKRHIISIRKHVKELAGKDYSSYIQPPHQRLNYTIMFVPNEFATQLALQNDRMLWRESFDKGIFITSEQNLLALLRMIQIAWTQVQQARNQQEVIDQARKLLDRVSDFAARFDKVGEQIQKASESFSNAKDKLYNGQQSIVKAAKDMEKLGYKPSPKRQLPEPSDWKE
jgi:DNA recombination protein RmuC